MVQIIASGFFFKLHYKTYIGYTTNLKHRLEQHNTGGSIYTSEDRPWDLVVYLPFKSESKAVAFEKYLKFQSGRAFAQERLW